MGSIPKWSLLLQRWSQKKSLSWETFQLRGRARTTAYCSPYRSSLLRTFIYTTLRYLTLVRKLSILATIQMRQSWNFLPAVQFQRSQVIQFWYLSHQATVQGAAVLGMFRECLSISTHYAWAKAKLCQSSHLMLVAEWPRGCTTTPILWTGALLFSCLHDNGHG